jgi:hypothetical protein
MFGNIGFGELLSILTMIVIVYGLPVALVVWVVRKLLQNGRKQDEILARLVALEEKRAASERMP